MSGSVAGAGAEAQRRRTEPMHSDRSSPSPVLAWYKLIPAYAHVVLQQQQCGITRLKMHPLLKMTTAVTGQPLCSHSRRENGWGGGVFEGI